MSRQGPLLEVAPGEFLFFVRQGKWDDQTDAFRDALKETWRRVPAEDRQKILEHHQRHHHFYPKVIFGAGLTTGWPVAMAGPPGLLLWCNSARLVGVPGERSGLVLVIAEELAHGYLIATQHPTHHPLPPSALVPFEKLTAAELDAFWEWDEGRERAALDTLRRWSCDLADHATVVEWARGKN